MGHYETPVSKVVFLAWVSINRFKTFLRGDHHRSLDKWIANEISVYWIWPQIERFLEVVVTETIISYILVSNSTNQLWHSMYRLYAKNYLYILFYFSGDWGKKRENFIQNGIVIINLLNTTLKETISCFNSERCGLSARCNTNLDEILQ